MPTQNKVRTLPFVAANGQPLVCMETNTLPYSDTLIWSPWFTPKLEHYLILLLPPACPPLLLDAICLCVPLV